MAKKMNFAEKSKKRSDVHSCPVCGTPILYVKPAHGSIEEARRVTPAVLGGLSDQRMECMDAARTYLASHGPLTRASSF